MKYEKDTKLMTDELKEIFDLEIKMEKKMGGIIKLLEQNKYYASDKVEFNNMLECIFEKNDLVRMELLYVIQKTLPKCRSTEYKYLQALNEIE